MRVVAGSCPGNLTKRLVLTGRRWCSWPYEVGRWILSQPRHDQKDRANEETTSPESLHNPAANALFISFLAAQTKKATTMPAGETPAGGAAASASSPKRTTPPSRLSLAQTHMSYAGSQTMQVRTRPSLSSPGAPIRIQSRHSAGDGWITMGCFGTATGGD